MTGWGMPVYFDKAALAWVIISGVTPRHVALESMTYEKVFAPTVK